MITCEKCGINTSVAFRHTDIVTVNGQKANWHYSYCCDCEENLIKELKAERTALDALRPDLESLLARWGTLDAHDAWESLNALTNEVLLAC